ncbi:porin family protein [Hoylesella enoeca]|uniref:porin family protein n=1 Tax=Hoylesella enoeca TaxID=76123 RepID=UPI002889603D|nr:porin family protein [Hoylesella enoeca]
MRKFFFFLALFCTLHAVAQVGQHRSDFSIGFNGGYVLSSVSFSPSVPEKMHGGVTGGVSLKYVCEKYFNTICSIYAEVNYASLGWKDKIQDVNNGLVINETTGLPEAYSRTINYIQIPVFAHLAWGKERRGIQFFINLGPQFGLYLNESTSMNFDFEKRNKTARSSAIVAQDTMAVEKKFDYGIAAGLGLEYTVPRVGHFLVEGRYYYGLGNIYGDSKRDYFGRSNFGNIVLKMTYLFDLTKTKK